MLSITGRVMMMVLACGLATAVRAEEVAPAKPAAPAFDPAVARRITPAEVEQRQAAGEKPIVVDTRGGVSGDIVKGAQLVTGDRIQAWSKDVPKNALIVTYCT
jgi:hypothetical protein